jgi:hypothetical protein
MDTVRAWVCPMGRGATKIPKRATQMVQDMGRVKDAVKGGSDKNANE